MILACNWICVIVKRAIYRRPCFTTPINARGYVISMIIDLTRYTLATSAKRNYVARVALSPLAN